jgi:hypothetical protein
MNKMMMEVSRRDWSRMDFNRRQAWRTLTRISNSNGAGAWAPRTAAVELPDMVKRIYQRRQDGNLPLLRSRQQAWKQLPI